MEKNNYKEVQKILAIILVANLLVAGLKILVGTIIKSTSMTADGFHSVSDGASNVIGLIGIHFASKGRDKEHPYGHSKYETLAGLFISLMLFIAGGNVILAAIEKFRNPVMPEVTTMSLLALVFTLIVNIVVSNIEYRKGKELNSQILISDSMHTRSDVYISLGVLATLIAIKLGLPIWIDPLASLVVAAFIIQAAYEIFRNNSHILLDGEAIDSEDIREVVMSFEEVKDVHKIRSRSSINIVNVDLHLVVDPELDVEESHKLTHDIEDAIRDKFDENLQLIAHLEPHEDSTESSE
ncbi:cation transporter [Peptostreptococcus russellii]|uniref:Cation transporter n=1 Tax=Peptostreptococcus russellii TaxID=215200 RepID=A0A2P7Q2G9_9FIRM|nr:cation diffusion facilitator family transporter [Peptostreptococcus russellii]PSJ32158.1 cation transporter [Peptostreptococcus russellii]